ncbi:hypothetical protein GYMLUDRAFT_967083 [Collybiopsis luxurians FD-317 M1]|uniref:Uncharacterized protein n=1 Tax=Collybiopsis luxurians FD-317 M1 TaxID=944289 RepID=A0A0D0BDF5_9AGAR|nr:hypothetical protein GYMLUDRAFT_967083 [Collybiopsis luxurians FD-317 M1]
MFVDIGVNVAALCFGETQIEYSENTKISGDLFWVSYLISLAVNISATGLIAWIAWNHRRLMAEAGIRRRTRVQKILLLLIESGAVYCLIQAINVGCSVKVGLEVLTNPSEGVSIVVKVITTLFSLCVGLYPVIVILLISVKASPVNETSYWHTMVADSRSRSEGHIPNTSTLSDPERVT